MTSADEASRAHLTKVGGRPPLREYVTEVWRRRTFIYSLARFKIESENQQNSLGMFWVILKPLLNALVYGAVFGVLIGPAGRPPSFVEFLIIGIFVFEFFAQSWTAGGKAITNNSALVQSLAFPRMVLPLAAVVERFLKFLPTVVIMLVFLVVTGNPISWHWLLIIPAIGMLFVFTCGLVLVTARLCVHWRDLNNFLPFITRFFFYTTGIFFSIQERFGPRPPSATEPNGYAGQQWLVTLTDYQPVHEFLSLVRSALLDGPTYETNPSYWLYATLWTIGMLIVGVWFFWRAEERYGRVD